VLQQRNQLDRVGEELGVKKLDDWYKIPVQSVKKKLPFISIDYNSSLFTTLKQLHPEHEWNPLSFLQAPKGYWKNELHQKTRMESISKELGIQTMDDWYKCTARQITKKAPFVSQYYNGSLYDALKTLYPQYNWDPSRFGRAPKRYWNEGVNQQQQPDTSYSSKYWDDVQNQRKRFDSLANELGIKFFDDWYKFTGQEILTRARFIDEYYNKSLYSALKNIYPEHKWDPLRFPKAPKGYWKKDATKRRFQKILTRWKNEHNIKSLTDWYTLPPHKLKLFRRVADGIFGHVTKMLREWFPKTNWSDAIQSSAAERDLQVVSVRLLQLN
jgi:hypothetical protein